ncbi:YbhB/YbcL family Raf kinase inhibitor-like protein [Geomonas terrae]|uniref:YbhB/YbcL family Raf kinase inhibitor-like protein n=1 Tax=Geomonas terrae TaxID=2562681 RepID=A0A4S1CM54_9BACT|nr:YbhB/YbcL family Raf kinase inhibitor-like protein [Geomonas terrae]TGU74849.1 YbhB/YbcL family Raf kinase inhibitor-like protein [Geomonas terrae]
MGEMRLTSPAFKDNGRIPARYTCDGDNINPELRIEHVPDGTKSLALVMEDPDAPNGLWVHWILWNMGPRTAELVEQAEPREVVIGKNSWGHNRYGGPCPPSSTHRYIFRLYALDTTLELAGTASKGQLDVAMQDHVIEEAVLTGLYGGG